MKKIIIHSATVLFSTLFLTVPQVLLAADDNPLKDSSFELQLDPDEGGWNLFDQSRFSKKIARSGERSLFHWGFSRSVPYPPFLAGSVAGSYQEFPASPGSKWRLKGYGMTTTVLKGRPAFGIVQVSFFDSSGKDLGTIETASSKTARAKTSNEINNRTSAGKWMLLDTGVATAPAGSATVQAFTLYVDYSDSNTSQGVYFDDLRLCALGKGSNSACD